MAQSLYLDNGPVINNMHRALRKAELQRNRQNVSVDGVRHFSCWPPKLLPALIDCNSSLPEGRWGYRRRTAGERAVPQQDKQAGSFISADVQQADTVAGSNVHVIRKMSFFSSERRSPTICAHWFVYTFISRVYFAHLTRSSWSTSPVAPQSDMVWIAHI